MKATVAGKTLAEAVRAVAVGLPRVANIEGDGRTDILIAARVGAIELRAGDGMIAVTTAMAAVVGEPGAVCLPGAALRELASAIKAAPEVTIDVPKGGHDAVVTAAGGTHQLTGSDPDGFPAAPPMVEGSPILVPVAGLRRLLEQTTVGGDILDGRLIEVGDGRLTCAGTDSVRLAVAWLPLGETDAHQPARSVVVNSGAGAKLPKILPKRGEARIWISGHGAEIRCGTTAATLRPADRTFPAYRNILPASHPTTIRVERAALAAALEALLPAARYRGCSGGWAHRASFAFGPEAIEIVAKGESEDKSARYVVPAELVDGEAIALMFNPKYMLDFLGAAESAHVRLGLTSATYPATFQPDEDEPTYTYILMPINL